MLGDTTVKGRSLQQIYENEIDVLRGIVIRSYEAYVADPTMANRRQFEADRKKLREIRKLYKDGKRFVNTRISDRMKKTLHQ